MADAEGEPPTEVRASSSARANRPLSRVVPSDSTPPSAFGPIPRHRRRVSAARTEAPSDFRAHRARHAPSHTKTRRALSASIAARLEGCVLTVHPHAPTPTSPGCRRWPPSPARVRRRLARRRGGARGRRARRGRGGGDRGARRSDRVPRGGRRARHRRRTPSAVRALDVRRSAKSRRRRARGLDSVRRQRRGHRRDGGARGVRGPRQGRVLCHSGVDRGSVRRVRRDRLDDVSRVGHRAPHFGV